jgi:ankyrin repeat protein
MDSCVSGSTCYTLHKAAKAGCEYCLNQFIARGDDVNEKDAEMGATPLMWASTHGQYDAIEILLKHGADINQPDNYGQTPLHGASYSKMGSCYDCVELLVEKGADLSAKNSYGQTPYDVAVKYNKRRVTNYFKKLDAKFGDELTIKMPDV